MKKKIKKLSKAELAEEYIYVRKKRNVKTTKHEAISAVEDMFTVIETLLEEDDVGITLGKTGVLYNGFQKGRNIKHPQDGSPLTVPDMRSIKFKPAPKYKDHLNEQ